MKEKEPIDNIRCPRCFFTYGWVKFRYTNPKGDKMCAQCGMIDRGELSQRKQKTSEEV